MASVLWTYEDEKSNTSNVILCPAERSNFWYKLLMLTKIIKQNYMVKEDAENFYEFHFSLLVYSSFLFAFVYQSFVKLDWLNFSNSLFLGEVSCSYNRLWEFSVTKVIYYKDVFANSFCSPTFRSSNSLVVEPFLRSSQ